MVRVRHQFDQSCIFYISFFAIDSPPVNTHQRTFVFTVSHDWQYERFFSIHVATVGSCSCDIVPEHTRGVTSFSRLFHVLHETRFGSVGPSSTQDGVIRCQLSKLAVKHVNYLVRGSTSSISEEIAKIDPEKVRHHTTTWNLYMSLCAIADHIVV